MLIRTGTYHAEFERPGSPEEALSDLLADLTAKLGPLGYACRRNGSTLTLARRPRRWQVRRSEDRSDPFTVTLTARASTGGTKIATRGHLDPTAREIIAAITGRSAS